MNLTRRFWLLNGALVLVVLGLGSHSVWNIASLITASRAAEAEYEVMDRADTVAANIAWLRDSLRGADGPKYRDARFLVPIRDQFAVIVKELRLAAAGNLSDARAELDFADSCDRSLSSVVANFDGKATVVTPDDAAAELEHARRTLTSVSKLMPIAARHRVNLARGLLVTQLTWTITLLVIALLISAAIHYRQFRTMVRPILRLRDQMRRSAQNTYKDDINARGDREFHEIAALFNGVARELADLYRNLENKIIARSRELVRSERLASVGFLAAGVAHEINNPLSAISGYAELAGKSLRRMLLGPDSNETSDEEAEAEAEALAGALEAQTIIQDEAFRCKEITNRLLSLARGGAAERQPLSLDELAKQVAILTRGLRDYRDRKVVVDFADAEPLEVIANPTEMKQVFLNLTVNALEAAPGERGEVRISGRRSGNWVELYVADNGRGMSPEALEQIFEPFYTAKRGAGDPGTGLGLSITHAIVENHGGGIHAESAGPGRGSRFTVRLPAHVRANALRRTANVAV